MTHRRTTTRLCAKAYRWKMEKSITRKCLNKSWFVLLASFIFSLLLVYSYNTSLMIERNNFFILVKNSLNSVIGTSPVLGVGRGEVSGEYTEHVKQMDGIENEKLSMNGSKGAKNSEESERMNDMILAEDAAQFIEENMEESIDEVAAKKNGVRKVNSLPIVDKGKIHPAVKRGSGENVVEVNSDTDESCAGRRIYVHQIPRKFNEDLIKHCETLSTWTDMCQFISNSGLGFHLPNREKAFSNTGWFATNQFSLEVIFHSRMKQYRCLTKNSSLASAVFVPYYAGLDVARYLWNYNTTMKDSASLELVKWLRAKPEWKSMWGRDHFMVAGRISWDFQRPTDEDSDWGNKLMLLPESKNMTVLTIESSPWNGNDFAIPYPTYFHPSSDIEVHNWQNRMRRLKRRFLYSFAGAPRPNLRDSIRNEIIDQCRVSMTKCRLMECTDKANQCHKPVDLMKMFQSSIFCLQPPGDSYTRRSAFDSILAGCIPVFFHPGSAYVQYLWHLPKDFEKYSVLIPMNDVKNKKISIERVLSRFSKKKVMGMREEVIKLIPKVIYADPRFRLETLEDAFDIAVKGVLERVEKIRGEIREGRSGTFNVSEEVSWKYNLFGIVGGHEWDPFFSSANGVLEKMV